MSDSKPTVLVIDNDDGLVAALCTRLQANGYECLHAGTGAQGLSVFKQHTIDLVITDLNMPGGNGIALAKAIRAISGTPIIVVTGFKDAFSRELRGIANVSVVCKPFHSQEFLDIVEAELAMSEKNTPSSDMSHTRDTL